MSDTGKVPAPDSMVDKARDEWHLHDAHIELDDDDLWWWICECGAESGARLTEDEALTDAERHEFGAVLAAAFAECEVTEQWQVVIERPTATTRTVFWPDRANALAFAVLARRGALEALDIRIERRLVITTPPVVVTPAQEAGK